MRLRPSNPLLDRVQAPVGFPGPETSAIAGFWAAQSLAELGFVVVMIDEPQGQYYGGEIAAPVFANIVSGALRVLAVPPDALATPSLTVVAQAQVRP